jgi:hypothetical protein
MTEHPTDPRTIQQQEQQHAERNRAAVRRGLQHARHEDQHETPRKPSEAPDAGSASPGKNKRPASDAKVAALYEKRGTTA